jgi:hypothetical protein
VYSCFLDATKAFDKVKFGKLFSILIDRKLPSAITRLLLDAYTRQETCVSWDGIKSRYFIAKNGVKQGAVLSPILFSIYIDGLLRSLRESGIGCHVGSHYVGALGYADDITILCPSVTGMRNMLEICTSYAKEFNISFNPHKTAAMKFGSDVTECDKLEIYDSEIKYVNEFKHLGHIININLSDEPDCSNKRSTFLGSFNKFLGLYGRLSMSTKLYLFKSYCCSFYGSQLWKINSSGFKSVCTQWNKAVRVMMGLPYRTHTWLLGPLIDQDHISLQLIRKTFRFLHSMLNNPNAIISYIARVALFDGSSPIGSNFRYIKNHFHADFDESFHICSRCIKPVPLNTECTANLLNIRNLISVRQNDVMLDGFDDGMIEFMINEIAVN